jgi:hypothetical protein
MTDRPNNQDAGITEPMHPSDDELSAYLNRDSADLAVRRRLEAHLDSCAECRERLAELGAVVRLLHGLESPVPKRSFRLDPSMVSAPPRPEPEPLRIDPWIVRVQPSLRRLTAIAAVLLVLLVTADVLTHHNASDNGSREVSALSSASQAHDSTSVMSAGGAESASKSTAAAAQVPVTTTAATAAASSGGGSSSSGSSAEAPVTIGAATSASSAGTSISGSSAADTATSTEAVTPQATAAALAVQQTAASGQPPTAAAPTSNSSTHGGRSYWRLVELFVGVVVIWLLFLTIVLPRLPHRRRS